MKRPKIDFRALLERTTIMGVADLLQLPLKKDGAGFRCKCPAHPTSGDRTLSLTPDIGFRCFAVEERGDRGDQIQLYAHVKQISNYEAADALLRHLGETPGETRATSPAKAEPEGRTDLAEMLGISPAALQAMNAKLENERIVVTLRSSTGVEIGTLALATSAEARPLFVFAFNEEGLAKATMTPDDIKKLFRVV